MKAVLTMCEKRCNDSPPDYDNKVLATLAFVEALGGTDSVSEIISALPYALDAQG